tara:strand:+ start:147 stop:440 length:294 start_codon:yes stop_codon:yes gene_type:complete
MHFSPKAKRELSWIFFFSSCLALMYVLIFGDGGFIQLRKYQAQLNDLQLENMRLRKTYLDYLEKIEKMNTDPGEIERIARERYNFARPGDIIVNLPE